MNTRFALFLSLLTISFQSVAQNMPIGYWKSHLPYNNAVSAATDGVTVYAGSSESFFTVNAAQNEITTYSKAEGMADVGISYLGYDVTTDYAVIAYSNGNIDLFKDETFFNIPDIKLRTISPKRINHIYTENGMAYLSTSFGIVVLNLSRKETKETYSFVTNNQTIEVREFAAAGGFFYAVTTRGLYKASKTAANLQAFSSWKKIVDDSDLLSIAAVNDKIFISDTDYVYRLNADTLQKVYETSSTILSLDHNNNDLLVNEYRPQSYNGKVKVLPASSGVVSDSFDVMGKAINTVVVGGSYWVADAFNGLGKREGGALSFIKVKGPAAAGSFDILPYNGDVWVAHGGYDENWAYVYTSSGISHLTGDEWKWYNQRTVDLFRNKDITDFISLAKDPADGTLWASSYRGGLVAIKPDGSFEHYKENSPYTEVHFLDFTSWRSSGVTFDQQGNLWITNFGGVRELAVRTKDGNGYKFQGGGRSSSAAYVTVDDNNLKWYILPAGVDGVAAYDDNFTPENAGDDRYIKISATQNGLNSFVNCIAKDKSNAMWIGTNDGIGVINCSPDQVFSGQCEIRKPIVQYDQFAGYLFQNEKVRTIAVDGANRKWIGTTNGVWLISPEGDKIIYRFTAENSPLPANDVRKIAVDPITGDVYIGTTAGLVSYRGTATEGGESNQSVTTFPNPVPSGYSGTIAIRGLVENADVRITDISGQLVYRTRALGGQAVWNGLDYTGRRPQSGVYLIFVTNKDGSQTHAGKMVFME
jgi:ligand-binding sensor domain-containing protein